ncbi:MAG: hypothetical protein ACYS99_18380 [Planctomycetota bacterium]
MRRRRIWPMLLFAAVSILVVAAGFWLRWGAGLRARYLAELDALRKAGEPVEWDDIDRQPVGPRENAYPLLKAAGTLADCIDDELSAPDPDDPWRPLLRGFCEEDPWTEEEAALVDEAIRRFGPGYRMIDEAIEKPDLCLPRGREIEDGIEGLFELAKVLTFIELEAYRHPERAPAAVDRILTIVHLWTPRFSPELTARTAWTQRALDILRHGLGEGTLDPVPHQARWRDLLADKDALAGAADSITTERVFWVWLHERWLSGEDPLAEARKALTELHAVLDSALSEVELELPPSRPPHVPCPPEHSRGYSRLLFHRRALRTLAELERGIAGAGSEAAMRAELFAAVEGNRRVAGGALHAYAGVMEHLTLRRLARVALAIHVHERRYRAPLARLEDYVPVLGEPLPVYAATGEPFAFERTDMTVTVSSPAPWKLHPKLAAALEEMSDEGRRRYLRDSFLVWEIRYGE